MSQPVELWSVAFCYSPTLYDKNVLIALIGASADRHDRLWAFINLFATIGNLALVVGCTAKVFQSQSKDSEHLVYWLKQSKSMSASRETWLCSLRKERGFDGRGDWASVGCGFAIAGRWMLIVLLLVSSVMVGVSFWLVTRRGGFTWLIKGRPTEVMVEKDSGKQPWGFDMKKKSKFGKLYSISKRMSTSVNVALYDVLSVQDCRLLPVPKPVLADLHV
jgi:hypothetical protein